MAAFQPTWESLAPRGVPEWFRDAKFGIFLHWGVHSATKHHAWYGRKMYLQHNPDDPEGSECYDYHLAQHGHPSVFGFKDFIPLWTAENWDADALVRFFKRIGARYVTPVALYHDNFDNFASDHQRWNSVNLGPRRDVVGEWGAACADHGLRLGVSDHASRAWQWMATSHGADATGPLAGVPYDGRLTLADGTGKWWEGFDPQGLYLPPHDEAEPEPAAWKTNWALRVAQLVDDHQPDLLYFDWDTLPHGDIGLQIAADYYNGNPDGVITVKRPPSTSAVVHDTEKGRFAELKEFVWQCDTTLNHDWFYVKDQPLRMSASQVIQTLVDVVSKNGNLLLNVGLKPDGSLPDEQRSALEEVGDWLALNGKAIFGTRPWTIFGEGPTNVQESDHELGAGHFNETELTYRKDDLRFTTANGSLFIVCMGSNLSEVTVRSLALESSLLERSVRRVVLVSDGRPLDFEITTDGLTVTIPLDATTFPAIEVRS